MWDKCSSELICFANNSKFGESVGQIFVKKSSILYFRCGWQNNSEEWLSLLKQVEYNNSPSQSIKQDANYAEIEKKKHVRFAREGKTPQKGHALSIVYIEDFLAVVKLLHADFYVCRFAVVTVWQRNVCHPSTTCWTRLTHLYPASKVN